MKFCWIYEVIEYNFHKIANQTKFEKSFKIALILDCDALNNIDFVKLLYLSINKFLYF